MDNNVIAEIKSKLDIVDFLGSYVTLKKSGKHFTACCPLHQEKSPSFVVTPERERWHCFGACHEGGDVISFLMKWENISFYEAIKELAHRTGVQLKDVSFDDREWEKKDNLYKINHLANEYYQYILHKTKYGDRAKTYLESRGLNDKIIHTFQIGYAPKVWDSLVKFLKKKGFPEEDIVRTGLAIRSDRGSYYDRFRGRIVFPIKDIQDNVIAFSGRLLKDSEKDPKYINVSETDIYRKRQSLYGIHVTKDAIRKQEEVVVVEGEFDVIMPYQYGVDTIVAIKGSSVTREHLKILKRYAKKIIFALDADAAGGDAVMRAIKEAEEMDVEIHVMVLTVGKDPDEAVRTDLVAFKEAMKNTIPAYDYLVNTIIARYTGDSPFEKKKAADELVPFLYLIKNPIVLGHYVKKVAHLLDTREEDLREMPRIHANRQVGSFRPSAVRKSEERDTEPASARTQKYLICYMMQQEDPILDLGTVFNILAPKDFATPALKKLAEFFAGYIKSHTSFSVKDFMQIIPKELHPTFDEIFQDPILVQQVMRAEEENVEMRALEIKVAALKERLREYTRLPEEQQDDATHALIYKELKDYQKRLNEKAGKFSMNSK